MRLNYINAMATEDVAPGDLGQGEEFELGRIARPVSLVFPISVREPRCGSARSTGPVPLGAECLFYGRHGQDGSLPSGWWADLDILVS